MKQIVIRWLPAEMTLTIRQIRQTNVQPSLRHEGALRSDNKIYTGFNN